jgi:hypothetical protein
MSGPVCNGLAASPGTKLLDHEINVLDRMIVAPDQGKKAVPSLKLTSSKQSLMQLNGIAKL